MGALLSWKNLVTRAGLSWTFAPAAIGTASFDPAFPAVNVLDPDPSKVMRMIYARDAAAGGYAYFTGDFAASTGDHVSARVLAFLNVRLPTDATTVSLRLYTHDFGSLQFILGILPANLVPIPGTTDRFNIIVDCGSLIASIGSFMFLIEVPINTSGYLEVGHVWIGDALVFADGVGPNWKLSIVDPSPVERARGGALVAQQMERRRKLSCEFDSKTYDIAMGTPGTAATLSYRQFMHEAGNSKPVIVATRTPLVAASPTTAELHYMQTQAMYASFTGQHEIGHLGANLFRSTGTFEEIR